MKPPSTLLPSNEVRYDTRLNVNVHPLRTLYIMIWSQFFPTIAPIEILMKLTKINEKRQNAYEKRFSLF